MIKIHRFDGTFVELTINGSRVVGAVVKTFDEAEIVEYVLQGLYLEHDSWVPTTDGIVRADLLPPGEDDVTIPPDRALAAPETAPQAATGDRQSKAPLRPETPKEASQPPSSPSAPWPGITPEQFAYYELTGWFVKGRKKGGKLQYATAETLILGSRKIPEEIRVKLFKKISTERWTQIRGSVGGHLSEENLNEIDNKHYEVTDIERGLTEKAGMSFSDPRAEAKPIDINLPEPAPRVELTEEEALAAAFD